jgi:3'-5' exoribonuclease
MFRELQAWIAGMSSPHLKSLLASMFADEEIALAYRTAPAAKTVHHNWIGGLIEHVLSLCQLAKFSAQHYPHIDFGLVADRSAAARYRKDPRAALRAQLATPPKASCWDTSRSAQMFLESCASFDFPPKLRIWLCMILPHHGELEYGSPKIPLFPEALLLHHLTIWIPRWNACGADRPGQVSQASDGYSSPGSRGAEDDQISG